MEPATETIGSAPSPSEVPTTEPNQSGELICLYGDCSVSSNCVPGTTCVTQYPGYSTCVEDPAYTTPTPTCHTTTDYGCGGARGADGCCNPFAVCDSSHLCVLPTDNCVLSTTEGFSPSSESTLIPSSSTAGKTVICLFGDCTKSNTVCVYGSYCKQQNAYFKQCVEDPIYVNSSSSCHAINYDFGCGGASGPSACCNPGATCNSNNICTLSRDCVFQAPSQNVPTPAPIPVVAPSPVLANPVAPSASPVSLGSSLVCLYGECTNAPNSCVPGAICQAQNAFYSQCIEDPTYTMGLSNCHYLNSDWGCGGGVGANGCCNPYATCDSNHICGLSTNCVFYIAPGTPITKPVSLPAPSPVSRPVTTPVTQPVSSPLSSPIKQTPTQNGQTYSICLYGDCSSPAAVCRTGTVCIERDQYYSQCVEDPKYTTPSTTCVQLGSYGCSSSTPCCNPVAVCSNQVCLANVTGCVNSVPSGPTPVTVPVPTPVSLPVPNPVAVTVPTQLPRSTPVQSSNAPIVVVPTPISNGRTYSICLYGDCSSPAAVCRTGTVCIERDQYYSQCVEDPKYTTPSTTCVQLGSYGCSSSTPCCNPVAVCSNQVCLANVTGCVNSAPSGSGGNSGGSTQIALPTAAATSPPIVTSTTSPSSVIVSTAAPFVTGTAAPVAVITSSSPIVTYPPNSQKYTICLYGNCAGPGAVCTPGTVCVFQNQFYSQCLEDSKYKVASSTCVLIGNFGCSATQPCCNPAATCSNQVCIANMTGCFMSAQSGAAPTGSTVSTSSAPVALPTALTSSSPVTLPTIATTIAPVKVRSGGGTSSKAICVYGDCTSSPTNCVAGAICVAQNPQYSQCLENPLYTSPSNSCYRTGIDYGCSSTQGTKGCCNPDATCSNNFCVLSTNCN